MKRIRIVQGEKPWDVAITDADTGEPIEWVRSLRIELNAGESFPRVWLEFADVELDIIAEQMEVAPEAPTEVDE